MLSLRKGLFSGLVVIAALTCALGGNAIAQQVFGSIIGTVTDPSGAAVNNAKVTITDVTKGTSFEVNTNESGQYTKGQLIPDQYTVTIEAAGFQKVVSNQLTVQVDQSTQFNAALTVGNVEQTVEVTAAAPLLQTDRADVAQTFTSQQISELPSIGRNLQAFELLNPGTIKTPWAHASDEDPQGSVQSVVNGLPFYMTGYYLDGTVNQDPILGIIVVNPTFDSVNEVKQSNQNYDAEFDSFAAGLFTYSTKSGTNSFHGDAFEYLQVNTPGFSDFARNPFTEIASGLPNAPTTHFNQFGGSLGGKIIKDKLFYFADAQLTRKHLGGSALVSVPTAQDRTGNLSDWLALGSQYQVYCPSNSSANALKPVPGNILSTGYCGTVPGTAAGTFLSPQAQALLNYFPMPNTGGGLPYNNYAGTGVLTVNGNQWNTRWDYYGNEKNTFFGRYSYAGFTEQAPGVFGNLAGGIDFNNANYAGSSTALNQSVSAGWTYTKSATTINEFRFGYMRYHVTDVPNGFGSTPATQAGIPGLNTNQETSGMPTFAIQNPLGAEEDLGYSLHNNQCNCPLDEFERQYQFVDNISHVAGKHSFKFGGDVRYAENLRVPSDSHRAGELYFTGAQTGLINTSNGTTTGGLALATFLLGDVSSFNRYVSTSLDAEERQKRLFWYGQDEWRPTSKLTITYGVRWEMIFPETVNAPGNGAELNVNTGVVDVFGVGLISSHGYQQTNWHDFAPRVGIAYQITPKTVVRAGYGWTYSLGTFGSTFGHNVTQNPPVLVNQVLNSQGVAGNNFADVFTLASGPPAENLAALTPGPDGTFAPPKTGVYIKTRPGIFTMPLAYAYNLTVQRQLTAKVAVTAGYVGNSTRHSSLGTGNDYDENPPLFIPGYTGDQNLVRPFDGLYGPRYDYGWAEGVDCYCNDANSQYNSFQGTVTVKDLAGYTLQGNYTYQVEKGDGYGPASNYTFLYDRALGYGNSSLMPHQQWVLANNYNIPFGKGRKFGANTNRFVDAVFGGWNLSAIFTYYSGTPFMPNIGSYPSCTVSTSPCPSGDSTGQPYTGPNSVPDVGSGSPYTSTQNRYTWIVTETQQQLIAGQGPFKLPAPNTFGNYPVNTLIGPLFVNVDANIAKVFDITERFKFQLRMDATNALNHANLSTPSNNVTGGSAEQITNIAFNGNGYSMRRLQFSGTLSW